MSRVTGEDRTKNGVDIVGFIRCFDGVCDQRE